MVLLLLIVIYIYNNSTFILDIYGASALLLLLMVRRRLADLLRLLSNDGPRGVMNNEASPAGARCDSHSLLCLNRRRDGRRCC